VLTGLIHQRTASNYARRAQIGFVTLGVGATALAAFALRSPPPVDTPSLTVPSPISGRASGAGKTARGSEFDAVGIDKRIRQIANYPTLTEYSKGEDPPPPPPPPEDSVKFLGTLTEPTRRVALLRIGDHQRLLGPGESDGDVTVIDVNNDRVEITIKGSITQTLVKQARSGPTLNYVSASAPSPGTGAPMDGINPGGPVGPGGRGRRGAGRANLAGEDGATIAERAKARIRENAGENP